MIAKYAFPYWDLVDSVFWSRFPAPRREKSENQKILHAFAPLQTQNLAKFRQFFLSFF